jgi:LCP family protein required for cell wall assembly
MKRIAIRIFLCLAIIVLLISIGYGVFFIHKMNSLGEKVTIVSGNNQTFIDTFKSFVSGKPLNLRGTEKGRVNILLLGIAGLGKSGQNLTDTIMIASANPDTSQVSLFSLPRDLLVKIPEENTQMKINSVYQYGLNRTRNNQKAVEMVKKVVNDATSLDIDYYVVLNFDGFEKAIDSISGINVMNERDIYDPRYPGPNYSYTTFSMPKGFQHLDGMAALKYARMRHNDPEGDFGRAKRQQQVLQAAKNKIFSTSTLLNVFAMNDLFNTLGENVKTDIKTDEFNDFIELGKKINTANINNVVVDAWNKESLLKVSHIFYGDTRAFVLIPRIGNWNEVRELAQNVFDLNKIKRKREEITKEDASIVMINKSGDESVINKIKNLLKENLNYKNVAIPRDDSKNIEDNSTVYDLTGGTKPFTLNELVANLPAAASYDLGGSYKKITQNTSADLVIVIGKDLKDKYNMEEDSVDAYKNSDDANDYSEFTKNN